jgi:hypothetical protein
MRVPTVAGFLPASLRPGHQLCPWHVCRRCWFRTTDAVKLPTVGVAHAERHWPPRPDAPISNERRYIAHRPHQIHWRAAQTAKFERHGLRRELHLAQDRTLAPRQIGGNVRTCFLQLYPSERTTGSARVRAAQWRSTRRLTASITPSAPQQSCGHVDSVSIGNPRPTRDATAPSWRTTSLIGTSVRMQSRRPAQARVIGRLLGVLRPI